MSTDPSKQTRAGTVYDAIRGEVLSARIPPGTKMKLADYSQRFDVSLSVVREALGRLAEQGLLQANPQRGFSTLPLSITDLADLTRARIIVEAATARESIANGDLTWEARVVAAHHLLASTPMYVDDGALNADFAATHRAFHVALLAGCSNAYLEGVATNLRDRSLLYMHWSYHLGHDADRDVASEHDRLAELAIARKADDAAEALTRHIQRTTDSLLEYARVHAESSRLERSPTKS